MFTADHHTHLFSSAAAALIRRHQAFEPRTASELVDVLDRDEVTAALVLSVAYFFAMPDAGVADHKALAAENDWAAAQVAEHPDRLACCCSVNPLDPGAIAEVERCAATGGFVGLKLHLANSDADLRDDHHIAAIGDVFECANSLGLMIVVHMRTRRPDYGALDAERFIELLAPRAPVVPIQIAHVAGWGGYDVPNDAAFAAFGDWIATPPGRASNLYFDIATAPLGIDLPEPSDEHADEPWKARRFRQLADRIHAVGIDRLVFGTDWPIVSPRPFLDDLEQRLSLTPAEWRQLRSATRPWMPKSRG